ncbi:hypothetical protein N5U05_02890 [Aliarcobacter butzleri]|uniref:hypothetical protein n=1 Tax=Aliarcobacter butzleri TaxID=28197 RepID=UPI0021B27D7F|nr:hypothetical protein [Aliarcobacter butzleri]MCT7616676.1 hypothetical protein [Aliarcobacter butzleri]
MIKKESNIYTQTGANSQQIGTQNNYYSISNPSVKIELKEPYKIYIFELLKNEQIKDILFIAILPFFILTIFISFSVESLNLFKFIQVFLAFYIILGILLFSSNYYKMFKAFLKSTLKKIDYKNYILIDKKKVEIIKEKETSIIINFEDIRRIEVEKNYMIGYNILIYKKYLEPTITYNIHYREEALFIKDIFEEYLLTKDKEI